MGHVYAEIELINGTDLEDVRRYYIDKDEVRKITVRAMVDSGAYNMAINENIQEYLQLPIVERKTFRLANDQSVTYDIVFPLKVQFENRTAYCSAVVLPGNSEPLLGVIPMEEMDVMIHPQREELIVNPNNPDYAVLNLKHMKREPAAL
jgi:predicted aspartyl protease